MVTAFLKGKYDTDIQWDTVQHSEVNKSCENTVI